jgi:2'-5' RNA ligase
MMIRAFFAIELPLLAKKSVASFISELQKQIHAHSICWIQPENLHITLQFLAEVRMADVPKLVENAEVACKNLQGFELELQHAELFPDQHHPKVISMAIAPQQTLSRFSTVLGQAIQASGYKIETRPFRGHITIGRIQSRDDVIVLPNQMLMTETFIINEVTLFQSRPDNKGSRYTVLAKIQLQ